MSTTSVGQKGRCPARSQYSCRKCKAHGHNQTMQKHKKHCPYLHCTCEACKSISYGRLIVAKQIALYREQMSTRYSDKQHGPYCRRCRNHNEDRLWKGHKQVCPYRRCMCANCKLIDDRKKHEKLYREKLALNAAGAGLANMKMTFVTQPSVSVPTRCLFDAAVAERSYAESGFAPYQRFDQKFASASKTEPLKLEREELEYRTRRTGAERSNEFDFKFTLPAVPVPVQSASQSQSLNSNPLTACAQHTQTTLATGLACCSHSVAPAGCGTSNFWSSSQTGTLLNEVSYFNWNGGQHSNYYTNYM